MTDYFVSGTGAADGAAATNGGAPAGNGGEDLGMDEISVGVPHVMDWMCL